MELPDLVFIAAALAAGAFVKGATGMGLPMICVPILTSTLGLAHGLCVLVIPILVTNAWQAWRFRHERAAPGLRFLWPMIAASVIGMAVGTAGLASFDERPLVVALAATMFVYIALRLARPDFVIGQGAALRLAAPVGVLAGAFQGATGVAAPIAATYVHAMRLHYGAHVFALSGIFFVSTTAQVAALAAADILRWPWLAEGLFALLPVACFLPLGQRLGARMNQAVFDRLILAFLAVIGLLLVARS